MTTTPAKPHRQKKRSKHAAFAKASAKEAEQDLVCLRSSGKT